MSQFFLAIKKNQYFESGTLIKYDNEQFIGIHPVHFIFPSDSSLINDLIEISEMKMNYLLKRDLSKRLEVHHSNLLERIECLKPYDECYFIDGKYRERCSIIESRVEDYQFSVRTKDKKVKQISMLDVDLIVNIEYYISLSKYGGIEIGMIIMEEDRTRKTYPDGYFVSSLIDKLEKIPREEAHFLCKYPINERLKIHGDKLWEQINRLNVGDRCSLVSGLEHPSYEIIGKEMRDDTIEYIVQSVVGYIVCVDQAEIRPGRLDGGRLDSIEGETSLKLAIDRSVSTSPKTSPIGLPNNDETQLLVASTVYFESTIIDPRSVITIEQRQFEEWTYETNVEFRLGFSYRQYCGTLKWIGLINKIMSAVVHVNLVAKNDPIYPYICSSEIVGRLKLSLFDHMVIVLLATVINSKTIEDREHIESVFRFIDSKRLNVDYLLELIDTKNTRVLNHVVNHWHHPIYLERYPELLPTLIHEAMFDVLSVLLNHFVTTPNDNAHLLILAKEFLLIDDYPNFLLATKKCTNVNFVFGNGETFLTDILKCSDNENLINKVIESKLFNVNKTNDKGESPLVLACRQLLVSTVRLLLDNGSNASFQNNMALNTATDLSNNNSDSIQLQRAREVISIFTTEIRQELNICTICMDRHINTALNCGHTMCELCSLRIANCPECSRNISERKRIFLP